MTWLSIDEVDTPFYLAYGRTLGTWAAIERELGGLFVRMSGTTQAIGLAIYYSAKSFAGRSDMVAALVDHTRTVPSGKEFIRRAVALANEYSQTRNRLAHDIHIIDAFNAFAPFKPGAELPKARRAIWRPVAGSKMLVEEIEATAVCFGQFVMVLQATVTPAVRGKTLLRAPELGLELLDRLPRDPTQTALDPSGLDVQLREILRY